jgi:hypothetical protein
MSVARCVVIDLEGMSGAIKVDDIDLSQHVSGFDSEYRQQIEHAAMRRALYEVIWIVTHPPKENVRARPCPALSDEEIKARLKELIND